MALVINKNTLGYIWRNESGRCSVELKTEKKVRRLSVKNHEDGRFETAESVYKGRVKRNCK